MSAKVRYHISSERATTIKQSAGLSGEPIGEPLICSYTEEPRQGVDLLEAFGEDIVAWQNTYT